MLEIDGGSYRSVTSLRKLRKETRVYRVRKGEFRKPQDSLYVKGFGPSDITGEENYVDLVVGEEEVEKVFRNYLHKVKNLGITSGIVVGADSHQAYLWNVFREDFSLEKVRDERYSRLNKINYDLAKRFSRHPNAIHMAYLNPSDLARHFEVCKARNIDLQVITF